MKKILSAVLVACTFTFCFAAILSANEHKESLEHHRSFDPGTLG